MYIHMCAYTYVCKYISMHPRTTNLEYFAVLLLPAFFYSETHVP